MGEDDGGAERARFIIEGLQAVGHMRLVTEYFMNIYPMVRANVVSNE